jgi:diguanylate cyclase (GGDEF)-like protein
LSGIRFRLLLLVALATGPLFAFILHQGLEERRRAGVRERAEARRLVQLFAAEHRRVVSDAQRILFLLGQGQTVQRAERAACADLFRSVVAASPGFTNVLLADHEGNVVAGAHPGSVGVEDRTLLDAAAASSFAVGPIRLAASTSFPAFDVAHVVPTGGGAPRRLLLARIEMGWVANEFEIADLGPLTRLTLWDTSGRVLLRHPDPEGFLGRDASTTEVWRAVQATGGEGTAEAEGGDGVRRLYGFTRLAGAGSGEGPVLALGVPTEVAFAPLRRLERRNLLVLALVTGLAVAVAVLGGQRLVQLFGGMQRLAERDALTGLANRRRLRAAGEEEYRRARRFGHPLAALMLDLDHFKRVNDRHGHGAGDDVLREVARRIQAIVREMDLPARYGGEEFAVVLPETGLDTAREVAERIRRAVMDSPVRTRQGPVAVTLSAGVAVTGARTGDLGTLLEAADAALYAAKTAGRNRVAVAPQPDAVPG